MLFIKIYIQRREEYIDGETVGANESEEPYIEIICFIIVGITSSIPFIIKIPRNRNQWRFAE